MAAKFGRVLTYEGRCSSQTPFCHYLRFNDVKVDLEKEGAPKRSTTLKMKFNLRTSLINDNRSARNYLFCSHLLQKVMRRF